MKVASDEMHRHAPDRALPKMVVMIPKKEYSVNGTKGETEILEAHSQFISTLVEKEYSLRIATDGSFFLPQGGFLRHPSHSFYHAHSCNEQSTLSLRGSVGIPPGIGNLRPEQVIDNIYILGESPNNNMQE